MGLFAPDKNKGNSFELLPKGLLAWARVDFKEFKLSQETGGRYANMVATVVCGTYSERLLFFVLADINDVRNSEKFREMCIGHLQRFCEAKGIFQQNHRPSYDKFDNMSFEQIIDHIFNPASRSDEDRTVGIEVGVSKGRDGHKDSNNVEFLSPNTDSATFKNYKKLEEAAAAGEVLPAVKPGAPGAVVPPLPLFAQGTQAGAQAALQQPAASVPQPTLSAAPAAAPVAAETVPPWMAAQQANAGKKPF